MKLKYLLILLFGCFNAFSQDFSSISFEEKQTDSINTKIDSILLIGIGSTVTRIFLDDFSKSIKKDFKNENIVANYIYLGKTAAEGKSGFDTISKKGYKAILFFLPKGVSHFDVQGGLNNSGIGPITTTTAYSQIEYQQDFNFNLYIPDANMKKVWAASIKVSGDLSKSKTSNKLAAKLLSSFKKNKYIN